MRLIPLRNIHDYIMNMHLVLCCSYWSMQVANSLIPISISWLAKDGFHHYSQESAFTQCLYDDDGALRMRRDEAKRWSGAALLFPGLGTL